MANTTRERLLDVARHQFAARGYYGTSIAAIAQTLGISKQALLHHFGSKEKLYGEVLASIASRLMDVLVRAQHVDPDPVTQLETLIATVWGEDEDAEVNARLIMRELLDNEARAQGAGHWYLKPWLEQLIRMVQRIPDQESLADGQALATVYQLLGAANYIAMSGPTLHNMFGDRMFKAMVESHAPALSRLVRSRFGAE